MKRFIKRVNKKIATTILFIFLITTITGSAMADGGSDISLPIYHQHIGNSSIAGGCYGTAVYTNFGTHGVTEYSQCGGHVTSWVWNESEGIWHSITSCGHDCDSGLCRGGSWSFEPSTGAQCKYSTVTGSHQVCNYCGSQYCDGNHITSYALNCGLTEASEVATLNCNKSNNDWTTALDLTAFYTVLDASCVPTVDPYVWDGVASSTDVLPITENGVHTLQLNANSTCNTGGAVISVDIHNIDYTEPMISLSGNQTEFVLSANIVVQAEDLQPDGTNGSGLIAEPYSYDNGLTWVSNDNLYVTENGTYTVLVKDVVEKIGSASILIDCVDTTPAVISSNTINPSGYVNGDVVITTIAYDLECGLAAEPYSYDNGVTWVSNNTLTVANNGNYHIIVRNVLGLQSSIDTVIDNIDRIKPDFDLITSPLLSQWTEDSLFVTLNATDDESGLASKGYSFDSWGNWTESATIEITKDGDYTFMVRDNAGNSTSKSFHFERKVIPLVLPIIEVAEVADTNINKIVPPIKNNTEVLEEEPTEEPTEEIIEEIVEEPTVEIIEEPVVEPMDINLEPNSTVAIVRTITAMISVSSGGFGSFFFFIWWRRRKVRGSIIGENVDGLLITLVGKDSLETYTNELGDFIFKNVKEDNLIFTVYNIDSDAVFSAEIYTKGKTEEEIFTVIESNVLSYEFTKHGKIFDVKIEM